MTTAKFTKMGGEWYISLPQADFAEGAEITVTKHNGTTSRVRIDDWMEKDGDNYLCAFTNLDPQPARKRTTKPAPKRCASTGNKATAKQINFALKLMRANGINCGTHFDIDGFRFTESDIRSMSKREISDFISANI